MTSRAASLALLCAAWLLPTPSRASACEVEGCACDRAPIACRRDGAWHVAESPNFQVCSLQSAAEAERVARRCECVRRQIVAVWNSTAEAWSPRCQVVLHPTARDYVRAIGAGSETTVGSSLVTPTRGDVTARRLDLRSDVDDVLTAALPHELCHVVIADLFRNGAPPLWFDEGVALQYDPPAKRLLHERDLQLGLSRGTAYSLPELLALKGYPPADRWGVFYGQSAALVAKLLKSGSAAQLVRCAESTPQGALVALGDVRELHAWRDVATNSPPAPAIKLVSFASATAER